MNIYIYAVIQFFACSIFKPVQFFLFFRLWYWIENGLSQSPLTILTTNRITFPTTNHNTDQSITSTVTWLWRWLPLRLSKHQSLPIVLLQDYFHPHYQILSRYMYDNEYQTKKNQIEQVWKKLNKETWNTNFEHNIQCMRMLLTISVTKGLLLPIFPPPCWREWRVFSLIKEQQACWYMITNE